jgi:hypothetical protein
MNVRRSVKERKNRPSISGEKNSSSVSVIVVAGVAWFDETQVALGVDDVTRVEERRWFLVGCLYWSASDF